MDNIYLYVGEARRMYIQVSVANEEEFEILNPTYEVLFKGASYDAGYLHLDAEKHELSFMLEPREAGLYTLVVSFDVAGEHIVRSHGIYARETPKVM